VRTKLRSAQAQERDLPTEDVPAPVVVDVPVIVEDVDVLEEASIFSLIDRSLPFNLKWASTKLSFDSAKRKPKAQAL